MTQTKLDLHTSCAGVVTTAGLRETESLPAWRQASLRRAGAKVASRRGDTRAKDRVER